MVRAAVGAAVPASSAAVLARSMLPPGPRPKIVTTLHGTDTTLLGRDPGYGPAIRYALALFRRGHGRVGVLPWHRRSSYEPDAPARGVPQSPRWRVGLVCAKDAKLSCRGNTSVTKPGASSMSIGRPIREFRRIVERGDVKTGCNYQQFPPYGFSLEKTLVFDLAFRKSLAQNASLDLPS